MAADYGAPTKRKRFFMIARCDGAPIMWPKPTHAPADSEEFKPLPEDMKKKYMEKFKAPERFFMTADGIKAVKLDTKNQKSDIRER